MFFADITLFYLIPLVLSVVLYTLISIMLLYTAPRTFNDGSVRNQARLQVYVLNCKKMSEPCVPFSPVKKYGILRCFP